MAVPLARETPSACSLRLGLQREGRGRLLCSFSVSFPPQAGAPSHCHSLWIPESRSLQSGGEGTFPPGISVNPACITGPLS